MNPILRNIIFSLILGTLAFVISQFISGRPIISPATDYAVLAVSILAVLLGTSLAGGAPKSTPAKRAAAKPAAVTKGNETGTVKWFNVKKGYGFITRDSGDDVFVHYRNIEGNGRRALAEGQRVSFIVVDGDKGLQADNVEAI